MKEIAYEIVCELRNAERPVLIFGYGIKLAHAEEEARKFASRSGIPVCPTWAALDVFPNCVGGFGTHGTRVANFAVQNADFILSIGSRLDTKATGSPASHFAPKAKLVMVDIDSAELRKMERIGRPLHRAVEADASDFLRILNFFLYLSSLYSPWRARIEEWKQKYPAVDSNYHVGDGPNPYRVVDKLSDLLKPNDIIVSDTGCPLGWMMQAFKFKGQEFIHAFNQTPMGYGLPAAIGAAFASGKRIILITGDGGLAVNITEMATLVRHSLPIKIVLFNNRGHAMCRQTQRTWLGGTYPSTSYDGGLAVPDYEAIAAAYKIPVYKDIETLLRIEGSGFLNLDISLDYQIVPQVRFGQELHDADPQLPREELAEIMA